MTMAFAAIPDLFEDDEEGTNISGNKINGDNKNYSQIIELSALSEEYSNKWSGLAAICNATAELFQLFAEKMDIEFIPYYDNKLPVVNNIMDIADDDIENYIVGCHKTAAGKIKAVAKIKSEESLKDLLLCHDNGLCKWLVQHTVGCFSCDINYICIKFAGMIKMLKGMYVDLVELKVMIKMFLPDYAPDFQL